MTKENINNLLLTRVAVAVLGEKNGWWKTKFFNESSKIFLNFTFPRSKNVQYAAAFDAIKSIIDKKVGPNHFHLFRLSINYEEQIHNQLLKGDFDEYLSFDKARELLNEFAKSLPVDIAQGPKNIGSINEIDDNLIQAFAAEYLKAFESNVTVYPYLN
ncbi:BrxE family protein [Gaetbulibacter saemankumensis]|uniref:BrxE family protein n=1 Tax=Gaetbulibacter saemankumensis TaxID=311208 RepID=UPI00041EAFDE|nr:BrxE family protein [Gaetbulibacter saemankumensis]